MSGTPSITAIEAAFYRHPAVREACAVPIPQPDGSVEVRAYASLQPGATITEFELLAYCGNVLGPAGGPRSVTLLADLPRTALGKIARQALIRRR